jgi:hypothetical protein
MTTQYMTDPALVASLRSQQYVVLRPRASVADFYGDAQSEILTRLPDGTPHPNTGHVTLRGFFEPERVHALRETIAAWASSRPGIELVVAAVDGFPPPFQVLIARLERTSSLVDAYSSLTGVLDATNFHRIGELSLHDWVFHLSLAYAGSLGEQEWAAQFEANRRVVPSGPREIVSDVDFVWYDDEGEHVDKVPFRAAV